MESNKEVIPLDIQIEILLLLPLKSLIRFICVSKTMQSTILGKQFQDLYFIRSMTRPRLLFIFRRKYSDQPSTDVFHSVYQEENNTLLSSGEQHVLYKPESKYATSAPIRGLVCIHTSTKVEIFNPGTNKFRTLPGFGRRVVSSHFGYDEVTNVFKVLSTTSTSKPARKFWLRDHLVFTVGSDKEWRPVVCPHHYTPVTNALCIKGVLYYGVWPYPQDKPTIMNFNVRSEEFTATELPEGFKMKINSSLVNYNGTLGLVNDPALELYVNGEFEICVRNEVSGEWRVEHIVIPNWIDGTIAEPNMLFHFVGTVGTGELVFTQPTLPEGSHIVSQIVWYYNTATKNFRKFKIDAVDDGSYEFVRTFLNHVDSLQLP